MIIIDNHLLDISQISNLLEIKIRFYTNVTKPYTKKNIMFLPSLIHSWSDYNTVLRSNWFWKTMDTEYVLLMERDSILCKNPTFDLKYFLNQMIQYKYVILGAPWKNNQWWCISKGRCSGNTGLSILHVPSLVKLLPYTAKSAYKIDSSIHRRAVQKKLPLPPDEISEQFSMQYLRNVWFNPFGCHKIHCCKGSFVKV